ncbi:MAG TPA: tRNA (adenosine(37)-N6)-dimethylallyltransferase MiaA [Polyangiaceae bacterium]|nr:tRNA (adenosine(37)-N6)-dimethylallyltransferase MiaA [Polyangiaceae bacterium]
MPSALLLVVGPTASGKTNLSIALAEQLNGEVVSADSVQIYRHFDIGSGKPTLQERRGVPHHLIDEVDAQTPIDAAQFAALAEQRIQEIRGRGRLPIVCGGTFLWVRALIHGLAPAPPKDDSLRAQHRELVELQGRAALHQQLATVDASSAQRLSPNDFVRVSRALEVFQLTGKTLSELQASHGFKEHKHRAILLGITHTPEALTARIETRVADMFARGWLDEVRSLRERGYRGTRPMAAVGYREVNAALDQTAAPEVPALMASIVQKTRVFARRQRTWLREQPVTWLSIAQSNDVAVGEQARALLETTSD